MNVKGERERGKERLKRVGAKERQGRCVGRRNHAGRIAAREGALGIGGWESGRASQRGEREKGKIVKIGE